MYLVDVCPDNGCKCAHGEGFSRQVANTWVEGSMAEIVAFRTRRPETGNPTVDPSSIQR
jgi:hypothetical protein